MLAAEALLKFSAAHGTFAVGIVLDFGRLEDLLQLDAHSLGNGCGVADDRHALSIRRRRDRLKAMKSAAFFLSFLVAVCFGVINPVSSRAQAAPLTEHVHAPTPPSTSLVLTVDGKATTLSVAELSAMPQK